MSHGQASQAGRPTNGMTTSATMPEPIEINVVVQSGPNPPLTSAFQVPGQSAATHTARKTTFSISVCIRSFDQRRGRIAEGVRPFAGRKHVAAQKEPHFYTRQP